MPQNALAPFSQGAVVYLRLGETFSRANNLDIFPLKTSSIALLQRARLNLIFALTLQAGSGGRERGAQASTWGGQGSHTEGKEQKNSQQIWMESTGGHLIWNQLGLYTLPEVVDGAKVLKMFLFRCKSCLNNITRCFMKFEAKWTTPMVWAEIQFKFRHWMFTYWATTLYPGPLSTSKHDRSTSFMIRNRLTCWNLVFHPFWPPFCWFFKRKWAKMGYLANYCSVLPHFCCNDILY